MLIEIRILKSEKSDTRKLSLVFQTFKALYILKKNIVQGFPGEHGFNQHGP